VPVQWCTLHLPIPLLPLWAIRPVHSLSACTKVHFTFTCTSTPLRAIRPVQSLSACTRMHFNFTYTSTPPMDHTACTEPQCLYNGALYLYLYLYSPYGPYSLNRASVPVQWCTLRLPKPLLPLWAVRPVQSLSACTMVHFTFTYTSTPPMDRTACTEPQCLYKGALYLYLHLNSPYGLYCLYRASVPVQLCTLPLPIPLLPLWTVQHVQSLSACTTVRFTFTYTSTPPIDRTACTEPHCPYNGALYLYLYLYSPYGPYGLYRASVPVQWCTLPLPIPLLPLWAIQPVQSLGVCTMVHFTFTYTFTPLMGRTACTEPQCLYNGTLYLYLYLYSPCGPYNLYRASVPVQRCTLFYLYLYSPYGLYRLYRASVPVQRCTLPLPIPLLPLWAIQLVQSLSACTTVHFTFTYTSTPPFGPYSLYRASVPVHRCTLLLPIPLLPPMGRTACTEPQCLYNVALYFYLYLYSPLWAVQPVQSLCACTTVHFNFTYTSTPPMDPTACREPQCLYNGTLYLTSDVGYCR